MGKTEIQWQTRHLAHGNNNNTQFLANTGNRNKQKVSNQIRDGLIQML